MQVVEHEPDVAINIPVQAGRIDRLPSADHTVSGGELVVEIDRADTAGDFPCTPATSGQRERIERHDTVVGGEGGIISVTFARQNPTHLGIAAVEFHAR